MTSLPDAPALRARAAPLFTASATILALMPVGMALAHRSSPVFLVVGTLLALIGVGVERQAGTLLRRLKESLSRPLGVAALLFFGWSIVSLAWSAVPGRSAAALGEFWLPVAAACLLALVLPERAPRWSLPLAAVLLALACLMILIELRTGLAWRRALGLRGQSFIFNRPVLTILVILVPVLASLMPRGRRQAALGLALLGVVGLTVVQSESGAAWLGAMAILGAAVSAFLWPRPSLAAAAAAVLLIFLAAPWHGEILDRLIPAKVHSELADSHSRDRIDIWRSFGAAIREQPLLGGGFGVSPDMRETPVAERVPSDRRTLLGVGHPHNAAVQIWAELGAVGAALAAAVLCLVLRSLAALPRAVLAPALGLFAGIATISLVGHGAWQGWWAAAIGAAIIWLRAAVRPETSR
jgi:exopolysaccharide production protein ExoQ